MGCGGSKLEELEAVALCRHRSQHLAKAIEYRFALAKAHSSYIHSLRAVGISLYNFILITDRRNSSANPSITLPTMRKGDPLPPLSPISSPHKLTGEAHHHEHSNSGSHIQFHSTDDEDEDDDPLHSDEDDDDFHLHHLDHPMDDVGITKTTTYFNYAKKGAPSSVTFQQRPDVNRVQYGGFDPSSASSTSSYGYYFEDSSNANSNPNSNPNYYGGGEDGRGSKGASYPYGYAPSYGYPQNNYGSFFGSNSLQPVAATPPATPSSSQIPPPPPPSPPEASTWDFLNPFGNYDSYQQTYTPSRSSRELREEEGIPDLEDDEHEDIKEAYDDQKYTEGASSSNASVEDIHSTGKGVAVEDDGNKNHGSEEKRDEAKENGAGQGKIDKSIIVEEAPQKQSPQRKPVVPCSRSVSDSLNEIRSQFDNASLHSEEIGKMLEVGKYSYHRTKYEVVSSKMKYAITPSLSTTVTLKNSTSKNQGQSDNPNSIYLDLDEEKGMKAGNLSSTLEKLYIWEKKLLDEVKVEEEMRLNHKKKRMRLERLDEKGAETHKIDSTRSIMMKLSTKIRIAIQVVDSISKRINKLRDEELWPELHELIEGLFRMWQVMAECHRSQIKAVIESNNLDNAVYSLVGKASDEHEKAIMGLVMDMLNWIEFFSSWISAQKNYVRSLNEWLTKCLPNEQEETADGIAPFSPGRLGAPPVFVICNHWSQTIDRISETEVLEAMQSFTSTVMKIWRLHYTKSRASEDDKKLKALEKVDQKIHKAVAALNKKRTHSAIENQTPSPGEIIHLNLSDEPVSLKADLQKIFEAMERFSKNSLDAYEELSNRCDEESSKAR